MARPRPSSRPSWTSIGDCEGATLADLYAGAGLFAVALAHRVGPEGSVLAVERDRRACADARHNGAGLPHLVVDEAEVTPELVATGLGRPSIVVLDPAREGAGIDVMRALSGLAPTLRRVVYVSCDAASFSRDARVLLDERWTTDLAQGLRHFSHDRARGTRRKFRTSGLSRFDQPMSPVSPRGARQSRSSPACTSPFP